MPSSTTPAITALLTHFEPPYTIQGLFIFSSQVVISPFTCFSRYLGYLLADESVWEASHTK